jgi:hypothetical protein
MVCPAYQSAFLFDKNTSKENFVYYNQNKDQPREVLASNGKTFTLPARDSTWDKSVVLPGPSLPIERRVKKDRYLLLPRKTYKKALRDLQTIPMKPVYAKKVEEDTAAIHKALDSAARSITDTITSVAVSAKQKSNEESDSGVYVITKAKEKFNVDQDNYMWYFRDILVLPDVKAAIEGAAAAESAATVKTEKKGFFGKLKGLFKKKPKKDSLNVEEQTQPTDSTGAPIPQKKKFSFKGLFKKKSKDIAPVKKEEAIKEEEEKF